VIDRNLYIACLDLKDRPCLVVGAGEVALEKIEGLLACEARVAVVAPRGVPAVEQLAADGEIEWMRRRFEPHDLDGRFLVVAATSDTSVNKSVYESAERRAMLVNVVDVPALCNFILPAIVRLGPLAVAVSTSGASPALAVRMKREIAEFFGPEHARLAEILYDLRPWTQQNLPTYHARKLFFEAIVQAEPDPVALIAKGEHGAVEALIEAAKKKALARGMPRAAVS
jgi:precorrin-2 dehydrogenase / sirohydrochlorin ferrochelatase